MTMFLSELVLNPRNRHVRQDLADCHELHRTILRGFGDTERSQAGGAREQFGVLYRVEPEARGGAVRVLVQSQVQPDWAPLASTLPDYFLTQPDAKTIDRAIAGITIGQELVFRLRANP